MKRDRDIDAVAQALEIGAKHNLTAEVIWSAMRLYEKFHRHAPETYNMEWALEAALNDWDI